MAKQCKVNRPLSPNNSRKIHALGPLSSEPSFQAPFHPEQAVSKRQMSHVNRATPDRVCSELSCFAQLIARGSSSCGSCCHDWAPGMRVDAIVLHTRKRARHVRFPICGQRARTDLGALGPRVSANKLSCYNDCQTHKSGTVQRS